MGQPKWLACLKSRFSGKGKSKHKGSLRNDTCQASASTPLKESNQSFGETTKQVGSSQSNRHSSEHGPSEIESKEQTNHIFPVIDEQEIPDVEGIWEEAYGRIRNNKGMEKLVIEYEKVVRSKLPSATDPDSGNVNNDQMPLTRQLAGLGGESRQKLMDELVEESSNNAADIKAFDTFSKVFNSTKDGISSVLAVYPPASIAWTGVCLVLTPRTKLVKYSDQVNASHDGLLHIIAKLPWYAHLVELLKSEIWQSPQQFRQSKAPLKEAIIELYRLIIEFQILTLRDCHHKLRTLSKTFVGLGSSAEDRLAKIKEAESEVQKYMEIDFRTQVLDTLKGIKSTSAQIKTGLASEINRQFALRQQSKLITKFRLDGAHLDIDQYQAYYEDISNPSSGTTEGFREHRIYQEWESGSTRSLLVVANPGTGKSVLTKSLHESLSRPGGPAVCSFFFKDRGGQQNNMNVALCHIMYQLFQNRPDWIVHVVDDIQNKDPGDIRSNFRFLWELLHKVLVKVEPDSIVLLLDALDESEPGSREKFIQHLHGFDSPALKLFCTARPLSDIIDDFHPVMDFILDLDQDAQCREFLSRDIQCVASQRLERFMQKRKIENESVCLQLRELLRKRVEGDRTYLFVKLLFDVLDKKKLSMTRSLRAWVKEFENIPETVFDAYTELLDAIDEADREAVKAMLEIVLAAQRPLTVAEMEIALKVGMDDEAFERGDEFNPLLFKATMLERCHFLLVTYNDRIYFIHQTVKDYLLSEQESQVKPKKDKRPAWLQSITTVSCHETILNSCMRYISAPFNQRPEIISVGDFFHLPLFEQLEHQQWYWDTFPFGEYAFCQWLVHLHEIRTKEGKSPKTLIEMLPSLQEKYYNLSFDVVLSMLCCSGFTSEAEARLFQNMVQPGSRNMTETLNNMSQGLILRSVKFNSHADLTCAIEITASVVEQTSEADARLGRMLINLSRARILERDNYGYESSYLNTGLEFAERALQVTPIGSIDRARALHEHAIWAHWDEDPDQAIEDTENALTHTPDLSKADKQLFYHSLATWLGYRFQRAEQPQDDDLRRAVECAQRAIHGMSKKNPRYPNALHTLTFWLKTTALRYPDKPEYLRQAIEVAEEANGLRLPTEASSHMYLRELSGCLLMRYERERNMKDLEDARELIEEGLQTTIETFPFYRKFINLMEVVEKFEEEAQKGKV
ncbi:hypothetical protein ASPTUDRAFT_111989 [Aspergillus tubingensis CBS 134.48]|uniref:NACHT domain-containing protein n=1 Tax=Aspergillus tubingensis (strain CBS 134.48) TaxID=767770 RepID=A0A1L9NQ24_ASPTC|nr:hypothetical protein ASPTUDRAFT_111989 [Aspergillus tubingensis CBS 134.48]